MTWRDQIKAFFARNLIAKLKGREKAKEAMVGITFGSTINDDPVSAMVSNYKKAEKKWLTSSMTREQEMAAKISFMKTYEKELQKVNNALMSTAIPKHQQILNDKLHELGISELMKDYNTIFNKTPERTSYILSDQNSEAKRFRTEMSKTAHEKKLTDGSLNPAVAEFQKFLFSKQDSGTLSNVSPFIESFMALPEDRKLRVMYSLEHNMTDKPVTDEMLKDYQPDAAKVIAGAHTPRWKHFQKIAPKDFDFQKIKACMDKEAIAAEAKAELEIAEPEVNANEVKSPTTKVTKRHVVSMASKAMIGATVAGQIVTGIGMGASKNLLHKLTYFQANNAFGLAMGAVMTGASLAGTFVSGKNLHDLNTASKQIMAARINHILKPEQEEVLDKLEKNINTMRTLNKGKLLTNTVDLVSNSANLAASFGGLPAILATAVVSGVVSEAVKSKIDTVTAQKIVDDELFKDPKEYEQKKVQSVLQVNERFQRMPQKLQDKYRKEIDSFNKDDKAIRQSLREQALRERGEVDLSGLKNKIIFEVSDSTYMLLRDQAQKKITKSQDEVDKTIESVANTIVKASGGKRIDFSGLSEIGKEAPKLEKEAIVKEMSENAMTLGNA